jgi:toxin ParE1/3/4
MLCVFSPRAERDLEDIGDYIARDNPPRAVSFLQEMREQCSKIAETPLAFPLRPELGEGFRMVVFKSYLIFYRSEAESVRIERVLHGARNIQVLFDS